MVGVGSCIPELPAGREPCSGFSSFLSRCLHSPFWLLSFQVSLLTSGLLFSFPSFSLLLLCPSALFTL